MKVRVTFKELFFYDEEDQILLPKYTIQCKTVIYEKNYPVKLNTTQPLYALTKQDDILVSFVTPLHDETIFKIEGIYVRKEEKK